MPATILAYRRSIGAPVLADYLPGYEHYLVGEKRSTQGQARYLWVLRRFFLWLGDDATMAELSAEAVRRYKEHMAESCQNSSIINALSAIRDFSIYAIQEGLRSDDPTVGIKRPPKKRPAPDPLYEDELLTLMAALDEPPVLSGAQRWYWRRNKLAILIFLYAGVRLSELAGLRWERVKLTSGIIEIKGDAGAKNGKDRLVPLHPVLKAALEAVPLSKRKPHMAVIGTVRGGAIKAKSLAHLFDTWLPERLAALDIETHIHAHRLRHTFASLLVWNDVDLRTVQELLGHAQLGTTEHYVQVKDTQKRAAIARLPDVSSTTRNMQR
jgi:integrase/recombinase XerD